MLHRFNVDISSEELPEKFNNPFYYLPHRLCVIAADGVRAMLSADEALLPEVSKGKMFGVLVVRTDDGSIGYLAAFSGLLAGRNEVPGFVPPLFGFLDPDGYFKKEECAISNLNDKIREAECDSEHLHAVAALGSAKQDMERDIAAMREDMRRSKQRRDALRATAALSCDETAALVRESQYQKAELKRAIARWQEKIAGMEEKVVSFRSGVQAMKEERKRRSAALQKWLFAQFKVLNAYGEESCLLDVFFSRTGCLPPAGAGECAAPKLLQYAYRNAMQPLCMAEFWLGASPQGEVRRDGCFYASCKSKCEPILGYMLQGLDVEESALERGGDIDLIEVVYEDDYIVAVNKPAGVLSVPGIVGGTSVQQWLRDRAGSNDIYVVHRLDMATSGLLLVAKSMFVYKELQRQFALREVVKEYSAILDGIPARKCGVVELPLSPDYVNRPRQKVDYVSGKEAVTRFRVMGTVDCCGKQCAWVKFEPVTGRTHQLRVHAACKQGLDAPIAGDALYGTAGERLMLHASRLQFFHPVTRNVTVLECRAGFESSESGCLI